MLCFLCLEIVCICKSDGSIRRELERKALVDFKQGLKDPNGLLSTWIGLDCCSWTGVHCHNHTGHIVRIDLHNFDVFNGPRLGGEIRPSLLVLNHLRYLDLSGNSFEDNRIPVFLGSLVSLQYLNLSYAGFSGHVPHQLGNLSRLRYLDLSHEKRYLDLSSNSLHVIGSHWLTNLSSLQYLNLDGVDHSKATNVLKVLNTLPLISEIHLSDCKLHIPLSLGAHINFTNLQFLDLSYNLINSTVPLWLFQLSDLEYLYLQDNNFQDLIHSDIGKLTSLRVLDLSYNGVPSAGLPTTLGKLCNLSKLYLSGNKCFSGDLNRLGETFSGCLKNSLEELYWSDSALSGPLPSWLGNLKSLKALDLHYNSFSGPLPSWLGNLKSLKALDLSFNSFYGSLLQLRLPSLQTLDLYSNNFNGTIPKYLGQLLPELDTLGLSYNNIAVRPDWVPPPKLKDLNMNDCKVGPRFPSWLQNLKNLSSLGMSNASIFDALPLWFWNFSLAIEVLDLSHNCLEGQLPRFSSKLTNLQVLDLSHNYLEGQLPQFSSNVVDLDQAHGLFSRSTFSNTSINIVPSLDELYISSNKLTGSIPKTLCKLKHLEILDLSHNMIEGVVPNCWNLSFYSWLAVMDLSHNNLFGIIPTSMNSQTLDTLHLSNNAFSGELPASFKNYTSLSVLDLGYNNIIGSIPTWLAENLKKLNTLELQNNLLTGPIPP
ncbi:Non-specific serine/threonine protein kinase protein [Dioscorea alata]|uniref:Non-specific serine/threonine protein kinase protein n=1 Tax=Dioscorea alata TaxID=55571 RepID=A0ACB7WQK7_DIOAL|nr:Non-specific serine/threonine protein kinase protein [Dioscorea alata]